MRMTERLKMLFNQSRLKQKRKKLTNANWKWKTTRDEYIYHKGTYNPPQSFDATELSKKLKERLTKIERSQKALEREIKVLESLTV